jgi:hypothetical protein
MVDERLYLRRLKNCQLIEDLGCEIVDLQMEMVSIDHEKGAVQRVLRLKEVHLREFQMKLPDTPEKQHINEIKEVLLEIQGLDHRVTELEAKGLEKEHNFLELKNQIQREIKRGIKQLLQEKMTEHEELMKQISKSQKQAIEFQREWKDTKNEKAFYNWITQSEAVMKLEIQLKKLEKDIGSIKRVMKMESGE